LAGLAGIIYRQNSINKNNTKKFAELTENMLGKISYRGSGKNEKAVIKGKSFGAIIGYLSKGDINKNNNNYFIDGIIYNTEGLVSDIAGNTEIKEYDNESDLKILLTNFDEKIIKRLNGKFAMVFYDEDKDIYLLRDFLGRKPLYYSIDRYNEILYFASEVKSLINTGYDIRELPPGSFIKNLNNPEVFKEMSSKEYVIKILSDNLLDEKDEEDIANEVNRLLLKSIEKRIPRNIPDVKLGAWLSGGLDSSIIASGLKEFSEEVYTFSVGYRNSNDLEAARVVAKHLGTKHTEYILDIDTLFSSIPKTIYALESFDAPLVRSTLGNVIASKQSSSADVVFSGEGGDEIFAGYNYFLDLDSQQEIQRELVKAINSLHNTALQRVDRSSNINGVIVKLPMLDEVLIEYVLRIPPKLKLDYERNLTKKILRKVASKYLPDSIVWRPKDKFWEGSGIMDSLSDKIESIIEDSEFEKNKLIDDDFTLRSKEELYYYRVFRNYFPEVDYKNFLSFTKSF
jgi:asparagine synthase (glutamine-hydrolysing)